ncbi:glycosyltransferase family 2 protein [Primorskyibacter flagellatus]|uniref:Glycosyl transferase family 2 n=1 Tax=Primorskyibacter flagellatus TaxID=1387277 RepID=A0A1W2BHJ0_9RHOB|nr:glycosyltransferase family 2 protein [Primorskyibacter flagellatus]SMC72413.1 Glycosyl transferase family 2 [Primorskyibacter flagellatus]
MVDMRWGIVSTVKAPLEQILDFAAWHLDLGAHRLFLYLDDPDPEAISVLKAHPKIRVTACDASYWAKKVQRPAKHQARQSLNARDAFNRNTQVDWLAHIDVDELLHPVKPLAEQLHALPADCMTARIRPVEALAPGTGTADGETAFKAFHIDQKARQAASERCFPTWGRYLSGGFLSHVAGKLFIRTSLQDPRIKIHNVIANGIENPGEQPLPDTDLLHLHAPSWQDWQRTYRFRLQRGSYRAELKPQVRSVAQMPNLHDLFTPIEATEGKAGLRAFYEEVCTAHAPLCQNLQDEGLLRRLHLDLATRRARHFPGH